MGHILRNPNEGGETGSGAPGGSGGGNASGTGGGAGGGAAGSAAGGEGGNIEQPPPTPTPSSKSGDVKAVLVRFIISASRLSLPIDSRSVVGTNIRWKLPPYTFRGCGFPAMPYMLHRHP